MTKNNVIIGGGYAGLFASDQLCKEGVKHYLLEKNSQLGGLSRTFKIGDALFDIGPHVYFNKDKEIAKLWHDLLGNKMRTLERKNKIFYNNSYIHSPLRPFDAVSKLGIITTIKIFLSFFNAKIFLKNEPENSQQWVEKNFGKELYRRFFKTYNEKIWGLKCSEITPNWAGQRIKSSLLTLIKQSILRDHNFIIKTFDYPVEGSQTLINCISDKINQSGYATICTNTELLQVIHSNNQIEKIISKSSGKNTEFDIKNMISSMPIEELIQSFQPKAPDEITSLLDKLLYRNLILILVAIPKEKIQNFNEHWIDIHDPNINALRVTNYSNYKDCKMSSAAIAPISIEYNCFSDSNLWKMNDPELYHMGIKDLMKLKFISGNEDFDYKIIKLEKAYPVYFCGYEKIIDQLSDYLHQFKNLQTIGRLGMYKWNNMHHSVKTGIYAAKNIQGANHNLWLTKGMISIGKEYSADE